MANIDLKQIWPTKSKNILKNISWISISRRKASYGFTLAEQSQSVTAICLFPYSPQLGLTESVELTMRFAYLIFYLFLVFVLFIIIIIIDIIIFDEFYTEMICCQFVTPWKQSKWEFITRLGVIVIEYSFVFMSFYLFIFNSYYKLKIICFITHFFFSFGP